MHCPVLAGNISPSAAAARQGAGPDIEGHLTEVRNHGGRGSSSYIDAAVMRAGYDPDDWAQEVTSEESFSHVYYLLQNWRSDTVLVVTDIGHIVEWVQYSAFGVAFGIPGGDTTSKGAANINDLMRMTDWQALSVWDARADLNANGEIDNDDVKLFENATMGRGILSRVNNRIGYAGYQHAPELAGTKWHVRHRVLLSDLGIWASADPLDYVDGMNRYQYVRGMPLVGVDPSGLLSIDVAETCTRLGVTVFTPQLRPARRTCRSRVTDDNDPTFCTPPSQLGKFVSYCPWGTFTTWYCYVCVGRCPDAGDCSPTTITVTAPPHPCTDEIDTCRCLA